MSNKKQKNGFKFSLVVVFFALLTISTHAQTRGFDFLVIVDQSGSMKGTRSTGGVASDSLGVRNDMVKNIFLLLVNDGIFNDVTHRFGVISFGSTVRIDLPLSAITKSSVDRLRERLNNSLDNSNMINTHFIGGFETARQMFSRGSLAEKQKRVVLLITDGAPYIEGIHMSSYRRNLKSLISSSFPYPDYKLFVVALNDPSSNYWKDYREFWRELSHNQAQKLKGDREKIFEALQKLVNDIIGRGDERIPPEDYDNLVIPPYLETIAFSIFRVNPDVDIKFYPADGKDEPLTRESPNVDITNVGRTTQLITVSKPCPGIWKINKSGPEDNVDIYMQKFFTRGELIIPSSQEQPKQYERILIKYRVLDGQRQPIKELPGYPLSLELTLIKPDGSNVQMPMKRSSQDNEKSTFTTLETIECDQPGEYRTEVLISTKNLKDDTVTLFRDNYSKFFVIGSKLVQCNLLFPKNHQNIPPYGNIVFIPKSINLKFQFLDKDGDTLNLPAFFRGSSKDVLSVYKIDNNNKEEEIPINFSAQNKGILSGPLQGLNKTGDNQLRFKIDPKLVPTNFTIRLTPTELHLTRHLTLLHWLQVALAGLLLLIVLIFFGYKAFINFRYPLKGRLTIERLGKQILAEYPLVGKGSRLVLKDFPNETMIKKIIVKAKRDNSGGINVTAIGHKKKIFLKERTLFDRSTATLKEVPYSLRFRLQ